MKFKRFNKRYLPMLWIGLALWLGTMLVSYILENAGVMVTGQETLMDLGKLMFRSAPIFTLLMLCLLQPILEEMSFRLWGVGKKWTTILCFVLMALFTVGSVGLWGVILVAAIIVVTLLVKNKFVQVWLNAIISSLAFTVCHISGFGDYSLGMYLGLIDIFGMALVCCWLTINLSFWFSCLLHVLNNSLAIILPMLFLPAAQSGSVTVSFEDGPNMHAFQTVIEPLRPFADNTQLIEGAANPGMLNPGTTDFYLVGEPAEIARMIASMRPFVPADVYFDWESKGSGLEERVVLHVNDINPEIFNFEDLFDHYMSQINTYLDEPLKFDTSEVMLKEIWLVYDDGREVMLNDSLDEFMEVWSRIMSNPYGLRGNDIIDEMEEVNDSTVAHRYYCRLRENPMQDELSQMNDVLDKLQRKNYRIDYRDGRKVTYITIR